MQFVLAYIQTFSYSFNNQTCKSICNFMTYTGEQVQSHSLYTDTHIQFFPSDILYLFNNYDFWDGKERLFFELCHRHGGTFEQ